MFKKLENKKGVTLVELLAVVVIMGIVAAIAVPTIGTLIAEQRANAALNTWEQIESSARLYSTNENDTSFLLSDLISDNYLVLEVGTALDDANVFSTDNPATLANIQAALDIGLQISGNTVSVELGDGSGTPIVLYLNGTQVASDIDA